MPHERLPKQASLPKQTGKDQLHDLDEPIALRILDGIAREFTKRNGGYDGRR